MRWKPYEKYEDSGIEWLGAIPSHWTIQPATSIARVLTSTVDKKSYDGELPIRLCNYTDVYHNDVVIDDPGYMRATATTSQIANFTPRAGDIAITKDSETANDIGISAYVPTNLFGVVFGYHLAIYRPYDIRLGKFIKWLFDSKYIKATLESKTPGVTRVGLSQNTLKFLRVPVPPAEEARSIANFLDSETAEIDAFIADQQRLIEFLTERRIATITWVVTEGINPDARMKESGVEWLGNVPAHWAVNSGRRYFSLRNERARKGDVQLAASQEYGILEQQRYIELTGSRVVVVQKRFDILKHVERGDFVISMRSFQGGLEYSPVRGQISSAYVMITPIGPIVDKFFKYLFKSYGYVSALRSTSNLVRDGQALRFSNFAQVLIAVPPLPEQQKIADYLDHEMAEIDAAITEAKNVIALSKERRAAVISAAVTGKIDVRDGTPHKKIESIQGESVGIAQRS